MKRKCNQRIAQPFKDVNSVEQRPCYNAEATLAMVELSTLKGILMFKRFRKSKAFNVRNLRLSAVLFTLGLVLAQLLVALPPTSDAAAPVPDTTGLNPYGANFFLDKEVEEWKKEKTLQMARDAGIGWMKQEFEWNEIEFKKNYFFDDKFKKSSWEKFDDIVNLAKKYNIQVVARLDRAPDWAKPVGSNPGAPPTNNSDFANFVTAFVTHYKGQIHYLQIWNEPNLSEEWNQGKPVNAAQYVQLLKAAYTAAKKVDPTIKILSAPMAMTLENTPARIHLDELIYWKEMYQAGAQKYFDIASANGYGLEYAPDNAPSPDKLNFRRVELLHNIMVQNGDSNKAVWFNEYGWDAPPANMPADKLIWRRVSEQDQANYTVQGIQYAKDHWPWAGVLFIWYFRQVGDIPTDRADYYFQMVTPEFATKPIYLAVKTAANKWLVDHNQPTAGPGPIITTPAGSPAAATPGTTPGDTPVQAIDTSKAGGSGTPNASSSGVVSSDTAATTPSSATDTPPGTVEAAQANPTATLGTASGAATSQSSDSGNGGIVVAIIGVVLVLAAGGGVAYYALGRNRRQP